MKARVAGRSEVRFGKFRVSATDEGKRMLVHIDPLPRTAAAPTGERDVALRNPFVMMRYTLAAALRLRGHAGPFRIVGPRRVAVRPEDLEGPIPQSSPR